MMWFVSAILIFVSISLLKGNYSFVHGKVFDTTDNKKGYAKELGKPVLFVGIGILVSGVIAIIVKIILFLPQFFSWQLQLVLLDYGYTKYKKTSENFSFQIYIYMQSSWSQD